MWNRPRPSFLGVLAPLFLIVSSLGLVGCGEDELADEAYGFLDLAPYFYDGSTPNNPTTGLPKNLSPQRGWMGNKRAEYYDFGLVNVVRKRSDNKIPDYAVVNPMYFFYTQGGKPMFSPPVYEERTGLWHMRGGRNLLNPNPSDNALKTVPYSIRTRNLMTDPVRNSADYQRPIVNSINQNSEYTGLWEIVEVRAPANYVPDSIKHYDTLEKGVEANTFQLRRTQVVINCPLVDDRTYVTPSALAYGNPTPRVEVWYRTKMGSCYLVNGFESLGTITDGQVSLFDAGSTDRLDTFDVTRYTVGSGKGEVSTVVAPVGIIYIPRVRLVGQDPAMDALDIRYPHEALSEAAPRRTWQDPPGYKPIRWLWDITVPQDPPFEPGTFKELTGIDPARLIKRGGDVPFTRNYPLIGIAKNCTTNNDCANLSAHPSVSYTCNKQPSIELGLNDAAPEIPGANANEKRDYLIRTREGGPRCDVRAVGLGESCAPGIARCEPFVVPADPTVAGVIGANNVKPTYFDHFTPSTYASTTFDAYKKALAEGRTEEAEMLAPPPGPGVDKAVATALLGGYSCHPFPTGYCYFRCDGDASNSSGRYVQKEIKYAVGSQGREELELVRFNLDSRCGDLPGYSCVNPNAPKNNPTRNRVCMRSCNTGRPDSWNKAVCQQETSLKFGGADYGDIAKGTTCLNRNNVTGCVWDPAFEPRPDTSFVPPL